MPEALKHLKPEELIGRPELQRPFLDRLFNTYGLAGHISLDATGDTRAQDSYEMANGVQGYLVGDLAQIPQESQNLDSRELAALQMRRNQAIEDLLSNPNAIPIIVARLSDSTAFVKQLALLRRSNMMALDATTVVHRLPEYLLPFNRTSAYAHP